MPKSVRLGASTSGSQAVVKRFISTEDKTLDGHITAIFDILEGDEVVYTCPVVGAVSDILGIYMYLPTLYFIRYNITPRACTRGKAISLSVCLSAQKSPDLEI